MLGDLSARENTERTLLVSFSKFSLSRRILDMVWSIKYIEEWVRVAMLPILSTVFVEVPPLDLMDSI